MQQATASESRKIPATRKPDLARNDDRCSINDLPVELLTHIFLLGAQNCIATGEELHWKLLITHVCIFWRDAAIKTAALWTNITLQDEYPSEKHTIYLERSQGAPLDIFLFYTTEIDETEIDVEDEDNASVMEDVLLSQIHSALRLLLPHVSRWRCFALQVSNYTIMEYTLENLCDCEAAPLLEVLSLTHTSGDDEHDENDEFLQKHKLAPFDLPGSVLFHGNIPSLKAVTLHGVPLDWPQCHFLNGLTELELINHAECLRPSYHDFLHVIRESPELSKLRIVNSGPARESLYHDQGPLPLLKLRSLGIKLIPVQDAEVLVSRMEAPNLVDLEIGFKSDESSNSFLLALSRPHPLLKHSIISNVVCFKLTGLKCDSEAIKETFQALTSVRTLHLDLHHLAHDWLLELDASPMPLLDSLSISGVNVLAIYDLVSRRTRKGLPLKELRVGRSCAVTEPQERWLSNSVEHFEIFDDSDDELEGNGIDSDENMEWNGNNSGSDSDFDSNENDNDNWGWSWD